MLINKTFKILYSFFVGIYLTFRKRHVIYKLKFKTVFSSKKVASDAPIIVSLTSYYKRFDVVYLVVESLFQQDYQGKYEIIFSISQEDIDKFGGMPKNIEKLIRRGLQVKIFDENIKSYKKAFYVADQNNTKSVITVDDDVYYPSWWLKIMVDSALSNPNTVMAYRGHYIVNKNNRILTYMDWLNKSDKFFDKEALYSFMPTGTSGVYYPVGALNGLAASKEQFLELCPHADDLWFKYITVMNGFKAKRILERNIHFMILKDGDSLMAINVDGGGNDIQFRKITNHSSEFLNRILSDSKHI